MISKFPPKWELNCKQSASIQPRQSPANLVQGSILIFVISHNSKWVEFKGMTTHVIYQNPSFAAWPCPASQRRPSSCGHGAPCRRRRSRTRRRGPVLILTFFELLANFGKLWDPRSRVYRDRFLQVYSKQYYIITRSKTLDEICAPLESNRKTMRSAAGKRPPDMTHSAPLRIQEVN